MLKTDGYVKPTSADPGDTVDMVVRLRTRADVNLAPSDLAGLTFTASVQPPNNAGIGVHLIQSTANSLKTNVSSNNAGGGFWFNDSSNNTVTSNVANSNGSIGFFLFFASQMNVLAQNSACGNVGVDAQDSSTGAGNTWRENHFCTANGI